MPKWPVAGRIVNTEFVCPPIPDRNSDWQATFDGYDGAPDSPTRNQIGSGRHEYDAIRELVENAGMEMPLFPCVEAFRIIQEANRLLARVEAHCKALPSPLMETIDGLHEALRAFKRATENLEI